MKRQGRSGLVGLFVMYKSQGAKGRGIESPRFQLLFPLETKQSEERYVKRKHFPREINAKRIEERNEKPSEERYMKRSEERNVKRSEERQLAVKEINSGLDRRNGSVCFEDD